MTYRTYEIDEPEIICFHERMGIGCYVGGRGGIAIYDINDTAVIYRASSDKLILLTIIGDADRIEDTKAKIEKIIECEITETPFSQNY